MNRQQKSKIKKIIRICICVFIATLLFVGCSAKENTNSKEKVLKVHYLSVGQADAILIECDGHNAMIDCGNDSIIEDGFKSYSIDMYLQQEKIENFDYIFCSHYDADHYDGFADILSNRKFKKVYGPMGVEAVDTHRMNAFKNLLQKRRKKIKTPKIGDIFRLGEAKIEVLAVDSGKSKNDVSLVLMLTYGKNKFLFMGDAENITENVMINSNTDLSCDVLKVAHHGSSTSSCLAFLNKVKPTYAILSVASGRELPNGTVLDNLEKCNSIIYRTDEEGTITCESNGKNLIIRNSDEEQIN